MARPKIADAPITNAEKQARRRARATEAGGRTVVVQLSAEACDALADIRASVGLTSDRAAIEAAIKTTAGILHKRKPKED